jgi:transcriptional regulator with XRE-family HTH domain
MRENLKKARQEAGLTQQQIADKLNISLRHYQKVEYAEIKGSFEIWDALEGLLGVHQRILRENINNHHGKEASP